MTALDNWQPTEPISAESIEKLLIGGDLEPLDAADRVRYYLAVCQSLGLNPTTQPFQYIEFNKRLTLYARRDCTDQLRKRDSVSTRILDSTVVDEVLVVHAVASLPDGRSEDATGAVSIKGLAGENLANAYMKAETKAKRRATLSICGLGFLDESELGAVPRSAIPPDPTGNLGPTAEPIYPDLPATQEDIGPLSKAIEKLSPQATEWLTGVAKADKIPNIYKGNLRRAHRDRLAWHILIADMIKSAADPDTGEVP